MSNWNKKPITKQQIEPLCSKYNINQILASILIRRGISEGKDILFYLEEDLRFQHSPFLFSNMEDAIERIIQAKEEGEKILIFGDSDVDGITSTAILYEYLSRNGYDVEWRLPQADDAYGLSIQAVDDFAEKEGTLIITVDCGISNFNEIEHANQLGIDVIVTDHHNPQEQLPNAIVVIDPKTTDSGYPFQDISGAAVAYKLVSALRFANTDFYNAEICLIDVQENEDKTYKIDCLKIKNLVKIKELHEVIIPGKSNIYNLKFPVFLQGQLLYAWDSKKTQSMLKEIFGTGVEFNLNDLRNQICSVLPSFQNKNAEDLKDLSLIAKYIEEENNTLSSLFNLYVTFTKLLIAKKHPNQLTNERKDIQLVALAALADIMPMKNENRLFVKNGITSIKKDGPRPGLAELFAKININREIISSIDLSWSLIPALNAAGRMGKSNLSLELLINEDGKQREILANNIYDLNEQRKTEVTNGMYEIKEDSEKSFEEHNRKLCVVVNEKINKGVTGILAARLMQDYQVPSIAVTLSNDIYIGSMRSCRNFICTSFLDSFGDFFINHGGHDFASGFSFTKDKLPEFLQRLKNASATIQLSEQNDDINIDAEIPPEYVTPEIFNLLEQLEPYGSENSELILLTSKVPVCDAQIVGKKEPQHLKLTFDCGKIKIPAMLWGKAEMLNNEILIGKKYDIIYNLSRNYFNGICTPQIIIKDIKESQ